MSDDILFENDDVCILKPDSTRGIVVFTHIDSTRFGGDPKDVCKEGLLSYNEIRKRHPEYKLPNRTGSQINHTHNDLIFFRAPFNNDVSSFKTSYGTTLQNMLRKNVPDAYVTIRIDPKKTYVYSSEIRALGKYPDLLQSRLIMTDYLRRLKNMPPNNYFNNDKIMYTNIIEYRRVRKSPIFTSIYNNNYSTYPELTNFEIGKNVEVVVKIPHIPPEWFVECISNEIIKKGGKRKTCKRKYRKNTRKINKI
jgi:hypothetical protein